MKEKTANPNVLASNWNRNRDHVRQYWDRFSETDLEMIDGNEEELINRLQKVYGYSREQAENEVNRFLQQIS